MTVLRQVCSPPKGAVQLKNKRTVVILEAKNAATVANREPSITTFNYLNKKCFQ